MLAGAVYDARMFSRVQALGKGNSGRPETNGSRSGFYGATFPLSRRWSISVSPLSRSYMRFHVLELCAQNYPLVPDDLSDELRPTSICSDSRTLVASTDSRAMLAWAFLTVSRT